jgi:hypothetical protein
MVQLANSCTDEAWKTRFIEACERFRFPYWDPCIPRQLNGKKPEGSDLPFQFGVPSIVSTEKVYVRRPERPNKLEVLNNPLFQYNFPEDYHYPHNPHGFWVVNSGNVSKSISFKS